MKYAIAEMNCAFICTNKKLSNNTDHPLPKIILVSTKLVPSNLSWLQMNNLIVKEAL